jgi:DNA-binding MarR family transcriptional regulator
VLFYLANGPETGMRMSELADTVLLSRSGLTRLADRLERAGLIVRRECESDQRGLLAVITDQGRRVFHEARRTHLAGVRERFLSQIREDEQRTLAAVWSRLLA